MEKFYDNSKLWWIYAVLENLSKIFNTVSYNEVKETNYTSKSLKN